MTARIKKEFRAILPAWGFALLAAVAGVLATRETMPIWLFVYWIGLVGLGVVAFGSEFSSQTLGLLLAQPIRRQTLWREKTAVLAAALASTTLVFGLVSTLNADWFLKGETGPLYLAMIVLPPLCAFAGGASLTLYLRQVLGALWLAALLPLLLITVVPLIFDKLIPESYATGLLMVALVGYGVLGCVAAKWRFLKMQDVDPLAKEFGLGLETLLPLGASAPPGAFWSLVRKEVLLQQINCMLASGTVLLLILTTLLEPRFSASTKEFIWTSGTFLSCLLVGLFPLLTGAVAITEERRMGVLEWQQSLPPSRLKQWSIKLAVGGTVAFLFGALIPSMLTSYFLAGQALEPVRKLMTLPNLTMSSLALAVVGIWASALARNVLQAMVMAIGIATSAVIVLVVAPWVSVRCGSSRRVRC